MWPPPWHGRIVGVTDVAATPRVYRAPDGRLIAGVARGLAEHLRWPVASVRAGFVALTFVGGLGVVLYAAYWAVIPLGHREGPGGAEPAGRPARSADDAELTRLLALGAVAIGVLLFLAAIGVPVVDGLAVPLVVAGVGVALVWRQSDEAQRARWRRLTAGAARQTAAAGRPVIGWRSVVGILLVVLGIAGVLVGRAGLGEAGRALLAAILLVAGIAIVAFPWLHARWQELGEERRARIRSEERAEVAAQVHDSVLQTLTLIQRNAADPQEVIRLARSEERALRTWLYTPGGDPATTFGAALQQSAGAVEASYGVPLDVVVVGEARLDADLVVLVQAVGEAMVNAAKHAGRDGPISVYAEVGERAVDVYVRDRGPGFDLAAVPADRLGVRESVVGRMERIGGRAAIRSALGEGTEVALQLPRLAPAPGGAGRP
ncbi:MAG: ATP-binding protein [Actinomycetota bacterium]|nr:MAG: ATP-binding protein [Actinomycetota bacterium]